MGAGGVLLGSCKDDTECFSLCVESLLVSHHSGTMVVVERTGVLLVVLSPAEDLQWPNYIHGIHTLMERDKNLDWLDRTVRLLNDCTHLVGLLGLMFVFFVRMEEGKEKNIAKIHATCVERHVTSHAQWGKSGVNGRGPKPPKNTRHSSSD